MVNEICELEMSNVAKQLKLQAILSLADQIVTDLCQEVAEEEMAAVGRDAIREVLKERERKIEELRKKQILRTG